MDLSEIHWRSVSNTVPAHTELMSYTIEPLPKRLRIFQQNLNKSDKAQYELINLPIHNNWDLILLRELYIDALGNTKANHNWHVLYPTSHLANVSGSPYFLLLFVFAPLM